MYTYGVGTAYPLGAPPLFCEVRFNKLVFCVVLIVDHYFSFVPFTFGHCIVCPSIYDLWSPLRYLQSFLTRSLHATIYVFLMNRTLVLIITGTFW